MQQASISATQPHLQCTSNVRSGNPVQRRLVEVHLQVILGLRVLNIPIDVYYARSLLKDLLNLGCQFNLAFVVRPVNFGDQGLKHRRTGRNFGDLDARAVGFGNLV